MTLFQLLSLIPLSLLTAISVLNIVRRRGRLRISLLWLVVWLATGLAILQPRLAVEAATVVGIGRGADLVFYCNVLFTLAGFFYVYLRQRAVQRQLTLLVRELALSRALPPDPVSAVPGEPA